MDLTVRTQEGKLNLRVAAWITDENKILVSTFPDGNMSLPGGRIKFGETTLEAVKREILEETGEKLLNPVLYAVIENFYERDDEIHELLFIFKGKIKLKETYSGIEENNELISWIEKKQVRKLKPEVLSRLIHDSKKIGHYINVENT
ncbi:NUDIX domain-containing protein [Marinilactibacillus psychrotolerans]|uniref:NUDIX domain-containing protein n=2 Tax=Marinilactibacillus psychrotolerans TaxID=191770 RepID=A0A5R9C276_9LACT|nr:NUDIX domain-containing protein [Marinilactibacillus psychrotolerans]TLQ06838.1 NUDIX domain-containing protein [Marinilactibacillus psychrotolerans]SJN36316.1 hypothetical protein FM115_07130 [Marinilactibacillus psychrotolerans 42ea]